MKKSIIASPPGLAPPVRGGERAPRWRRRLWRLSWAAVFLGLAILGGFLPILQGWVFFVLAILILSVDSRWIRKLVLYPLYRRWPGRYRAASRWRRRMRFKARALFSRKR